MNKMTVRNRRAYDRADSHKTSFQFPVCKGSIRCCIRLNYFVQNITIEVWFVDKTMLTIIDPHTPLSNEFHETESL